MYDFIVVALALVTLVLGYLLIVGGVSSYIIHTKQCNTSCIGRSKAFFRGNGMCVCRDGSTWVWQEGYTYKLGTKK